MNQIDLIRKNHNYRNLLLAWTGSQFGNWFNEVALAQVTLTLTNSPAAMGLVLLCRSLPGVIMGPLTGPLVDQLPKKLILLVSDVARAGLALSLSLAVFLNAVWILYVASALMGLSGVLFSPARRVVIPLVVSRDELGVANGLESQTSAVIQIIGAALGGVISTAVGPVFCFMLNAGSYLWSALHVGRCSWNEVRDPTGVKVTYFQSVKIGYRETLHNRVVRAIIIIGISWGVAGGGYYILIPVLGQQIYHMGGLGIGLLYVVDGMGVLLGAYFVTQYIGKSRRRAVIWFGVAYLAQALFFAVMTQFTMFIWGALMLLIMRVFSGIIIPLDTYMLQISTHPSIRGRVFALHGSTYGGVMQVSYALMGVAVSKLEIPLIGVSIGVVSLLCGVSWLVQYRGITDQIQNWQG